MKKIGVVGMGYVGLTFSIVGAKKGLTISGIEKNKNIIKTITNGKAHFFEKGINSTLKTIINKNLFVYDSFKNTGKQDAFVITVGTPLISDKDGPNVQHIIEALKSDRDTDAVTTSLHNLESCARSDSNLMPSILECVENYATLGEISDTLRKVFGEY